LAADLPFPVEGYEALACFWCWDDAAFSVGCVDEVVLVGRSDGVLCGVVVCAEELVRDGSLMSL
jgi:hypothetical protein